MTVGTEDSGEQRRHNKASGGGNTRTKATKREKRWQNENRTNKMRTTTIQEQRQQGEKR